MKALALLALVQAAESKMDRFVRLANDTRRPPVMGQAIGKLIEQPEQAVPAILAFVKAKGRNALSLALADSFGEFEDERIAALCVALVKDKGFFWRPAAMRSLSALAEAGHRASTMAAVAWLY